MKKLFALFLVVFALSACSSSDDDGNNSSNSQITPPSWIQGTWVDKETYDVVGYKIGYIFRSDDVCMLNISTETCWKETLAIQDNIPNSPKSNVDQKISDTEYKCSITVTGQTIHYHFQKVSSNTIKNVDNGATLTKI